MRISETEEDTPIVVGPHVVVVEVVEHAGLQEGPHLGLVLHQVVAFGIAVAQSGRHLREKAVVQVEGGHGFVVAVVFAEQIDDGREQIERKAQSVQEGIAVFDTVGQLLGQRVRLAALFLYGRRGGDGIALRPKFGHEGEHRQPENQHRPQEPNTEG